MYNAFYNMSTRKDQIKKLNVENKRPEALSLVERELAVNPNDEDLLLWKAFFLFHIAIDEDTNNPYSKERMIEDSIKLYKKIIDINDELNPKMFLAQIYAHQGNREAIKIAKENYKTNPSSLTLNRLIDVYKRLGQNDDAVNLFEQYEEQANIEKIPEIYIAGDMFFFWRGINEIKSTEYKNKVLKIKPSNKEEEAMLQLVQSKKRLYPKRI